MNGTTLRNFVDGEYVAAGSGRTCDLVDPTTGEVFAAAPVSDSPTWTAPTAPRPALSSAGGNDPR